MPVPDRVVPLSQVVDGDRRHCPPVGCRRRLPGPDVGGARYGRRVDEMLSRRAVNRATLERQLLLTRVSMSTMDAVEHLVGMQAQAPNSPYVGLWSRLAGFRPEDLAGRLESRQAVRTHLMRSTVHLVSARDCLAMSPLMRPVMDRAYHGTPFRREVSTVDIAE